jgi:hypothetical protein
MVRTKTTAAATTSKSASKSQMFRYDPGNFRLFVAGGK